MAYYTTFTLDADYVPNLETMNGIVNELCEMGLMGTAFCNIPYYKTYPNRYFLTCCPHEAQKWYDFEEDMCRLSYKFPNVRFRLHGQGQNADDVWNCFFINGLSEMCRMEKPTIME